MTKVVIAGLRQRPAIMNLLQLYQHYFSPMLNQEVDRSGRFNFVRLPGAWKTPRTSIPLLILEKDKIAGFSFIRRRRLMNGAKGGNLEEFFVLARHRRQGVGRRAARAIFRMFPGWWQVKVLLKNKDGRRFWRDVIRKESNGPVRTRIVGDMVRHLFRIHCC